MLHTKEFHDVMAMFEKQKFIYGRLDREPKDQWKRQIYYQDGKVNALFIAFLSGYMLGKVS